MEVLSKFVCSKIDTTSNMKCLQSTLSGTPRESVLSCITSDNSNKRKQFFPIDCIEKKKKKRNRKKTKKGLFNEPLLFPSAIKTNCIKVTTKTGVFSIWLAISLRGGSLLQLCGLNAICSALDADVTTNEMNRAITKETFRVSTRESTKEFPQDLETGIVDYGALSLGCMHQILGGIGYSWEKVSVSLGNNKTYTFSAKSIGVFGPALDAVISIDQCYIVFGWNGHEREPAIDKAHYLAIRHRYVYTDMRRKNIKSYKENIRPYNVDNILKLLYASNTIFRVYELKKR
jgi:hypothetical protein